jgi:hypothetical protein
MNKAPGEESDDVQMGESSHHLLQDDYCFRLECIVRERLITEQAATIKRLEQQTAHLQLKLMDKKGKLQLLRLQLATPKEQSLLSTGR